ncbi:hypothetical protein BPSY_2240 [Bifidobacterium psychraerophilum]|uniref:Uncharacterized protein n=1 Tax=Bifidobacterium psychraerophilum TaxID=218140 RepID=A0A087CL72_9BIFI|nr:hypothetical protein BPSY_2240 [Bifidobacterium psychraerophilum]
MICHNAVPLALEHVVVVANDPVLRILVTGFAGFGADHFDWGLVYAKHCRFHSQRFWRYAENSFL